MKEKKSIRSGTRFGLSIKMSISVFAVIVVFTGCAIHPKPLMLRESQAEADRMQQIMTEGQEPVTGAIDIYEAMARALKYNLNYRLKLMEEAIGLGQSNLAGFDMLPKLTASAGYTKRDNVNASVSESVTTGDISLEASTSQEKERKISGLTLSWNILDFGVSYFQAKQQADKYLIFTERRRKAAHNLLRDVRYAFWRAAAVQHLQDRVRSVQQNAEKALEYAYTVEKEKLKPILDVLMYQKVLLEVTRQLEILQQELVLAKVELAHLMNLIPGTDFELKIPPADKMKLLKDEHFLGEMERMALQQRPELMEINYQKRISANETKKTIAGLFPGINFSFETNYDSNEYLVNNSWSNAGARVAWSLMNLVSAPQRIELVKTQEEMLEMQQMTLSMAVLSQLHIAFRQYRGFVHQFERDMRLESVNMRIFEQMKTAHEADAGSRTEKIRAETNAVMAKLQRYHSFAQLQNALGRVYASIGLDPLPEGFKETDVETLAGAIREELEKWDRDFTVPAPSIQISFASDQPQKSIEHSEHREKVSFQANNDDPEKQLFEEPPERKPTEPEKIGTGSDNSPDWLMVTRNWSNIRLKPDMEAPIISHGRDGDFFRITGPIHKGWRRIALDDGTEGWIARNLVEPVQYSPQSSQFAGAARITPVNTRGVQILNGAGWHHDQQGVARNGTAYPVISSTANWVEVRMHDSAAGWIPKRQIRVVDGK